MSKGLFIIGTGTDVGKTYVSGLILKALNKAGKSCAYFKGAMSGNDRAKNGTLLLGDALTVQKLSNISQPLSTMCPYGYETAVSPHLAAKLEGNPVDLQVIQEAYHALSNQYSYILAEGSGGIMCPLRYDEKKIFLEDVIHSLNLPCLLIAPAGLGTINQVVLTCNYLQEHHIPLKGIILNHFHPGNAMEEDNKYMCEQLTGVKVLTCISTNETELARSEDFLISLFS